MTRTLILHIGHYKTGTTALQVFCEQNAAALARRGLAYATANRRASKHSIYAFSLLRAAGATTLLHGFANPRTPETIWGNLIHEIRTGSAPRVLISSEEFMRLALFPAAMAQLQAILATAPDIRVQVVIYLRPVASHLRAWHNQLVKMGQCRLGFEAATLHLIEPIHYDYALAVEPWVQLLGREHITIRPYAAAMRGSDALYRDFAATLGVSMPVWPRYPGRDPNPRLDDRLLDLARTAPGAGMGKPAQQALLARAGVRLAADDPDPGAFDALRARVKAGLDRLAELAGPDFPLAQFHDALPAPAAPAERLQATLVEIAMEEVARIRAEAATERAALNARIAALESQLAQPAPAAKPGAEQG